MPGLIGFTPDGDLFMLPIVAGLAIWWNRSNGILAACALAIYAAVNLAGAMLSVLPLGLLPFVPEQSLAHYTAHVIYAGSQLPLLILTIFRLQRRPDRKCS